MNRRGFIVALSLVGLPYAAAPRSIRQSVVAAFGDVPVNEGQVTLSVPTLAENGNSVSFEVVADAPAGTFVTSVRVLSEINPLPVIGVFHFGERRESVRIATRIRLADTQRIVAVAEMSDGSRWSGGGTTIVTLAACVDV